MTFDQRKMLKAAAKACGIDGRYVNAAQGIKYAKGPCGNYLQAYFNPLTNPSDTAEMCAKLALDTAWGVDDVIVMVPEEEAHEAQYKDHDNSRLKAWMFAATMVAAKVGGYEE